MSIDLSIRHQLVTLVRRGARTSEFTTARPTDWRPEQVPNPEGLLLPYFDDRSAWELIASKLESGHDVQTVTLEQPSGKTGYVMKIDLNPGRPLLYVKLELGARRGHRTQFSRISPKARVVTVAAVRSDRAPHATRQERSCARCEAETVDTVEHLHTFRYGAGKLAADLTAHLPVRRCGTCGFEFLDQESERIKLEAICEHLGLLSPSGIQRIRERYGMTLAAFADVTGLGTATLVRWENGSMNHTRAYDRYIRLLEKPEIMRELKRLAEPVGSDTDLDAGEDPQFRVVRVSRNSRKGLFRLRRSRPARDRNLRGAGRVRPRPAKESRPSTTRLESF